jgi:deoxyribodipyrimidine photo-lyase
MDKAEAMLIACYIFRRDLRLEDNLGLIATIKWAREHNAKIAPIFIFNPQQILQKHNTYHNSRIIDFMCGCLGELSVATGHTLSYFTGSDTEVLAKLAKSITIGAVAWNADVTPFARNRDAILKKWCSNNDIETIEQDDYTIFPIGSSPKTTTGKFYEVFTPFYTKCISTIKATQLPAVSSVHPTQAMFVKTGHTKPMSVAIGPIKPGRKAALTTLARSRLLDYTKRDYPAADATTHLSAYLKFGCVSIREVLKFMVRHHGLNSTIVRELFWREFYYIVAYNRPDILAGQIGKKNAAMRPIYDIKWHNSAKLFRAWCEGETGFPLVDAGIRQMLETGYMHNRVRMVVATFLVKDLHIDWRKGEQFFAQQLIDYDPAQNSGGWQWCASTGADAQPYFRIFNPWLQSKKYDSDAVYIKKWVPELADIAPAVIHTLYRADRSAISGYPAPIVVHSEEAEKTLSWYG